MATTLFTQPTFLPPRAIEAVRSLQRSEAWRVRGIFAASALALSVSVTWSAAEHPWLRVAGIAFGLALAGYGAWRGIRLERRAYRFVALSKQREMDLRRMAEGFPALSEHLAALDALGRPMVGDDEHQLLLLEPELASQWHDLHRQRARGALLV